MVTTDDVQELLETSDRLVGAVSTEFHRYLKIDWKDRLIGVLGARGTGKTTLLRQRLREHFGVGSTQAVYVSLDDLWFAEFKLRDAVKYFYEHGYTHVFMDEMHHVGKDWSIVLKNLYDQFPSMNFVYSGSSMLKLESTKGDLSRRQAVYRLKGLSFREYLKFEGLADCPPVPLEKLFKDHRRIATSVTRNLRVLQHFEQYLKGGFYPFYRESSSQYRERLVETVNSVLEVDYPSIEAVSQDTIRTAKKMLKVLSASTPQTPNMSELYRQLGTERNQGLKMLCALDRAGLLALVPGKGMNLKTLSKPEKIYCDNTNLMQALVPRIDIGVARETFFYNQVRNDHDVVFSGIGDFVVDGHWTVEVGGKGKGFGQIADLPNSCVAADGLEVGVGNKIPLWLFGFLY